jgi:hypothetical protein
VSYEQLLAALRPLEGQRVRLTYVARGTANYEPQRSGVLTFWRRGDGEDPRIGGQSGFYYAEGCITRVEVMGANGRYQTAS